MNSWITLWNHAAEMWAAAMWRACWQGGRKASSFLTLNRARLALISFALPATSVWRAWCRSAAIRPSIGSKKHSHDRSRIAYFQQGVR